MTLKLLTAANLEPVTLAEAKLQCRVEVSDDDGLISTLIVSARQEAEHELGRALITQTWERAIDAFPAAEIELGMPPVRSISSIDYVDAAGATQTLSSVAYTLVVDGDVDGGWVLPALGYSWPTTLDCANAVRIRFVAGYGDSAAWVPQAIRTWVQMRVATLYQFRSQVVAGLPIAEVPGRHLDRLLDPYRVWR